MVSQKSRALSHVVLVLLFLVGFGTTVLCTSCSQRAESVATRLTNISYVNDGNVAHKLDIYLPSLASAPKNKLIPVVIFIHGGGWRTGAKENAGGMEMLEQGFALISINYRLTTEATFPAQLDDCKAAIRWVKEHSKDYGLDPNRVGVFGNSAGGHLSALIGTTGDIKEKEGNLGVLRQDSKVRAVCDWCGPSDLLTFIEQSSPDNPLDVKSPHGLLALFLGGLPQDKVDQAKAASPIEFVSADDPPFLIMHGDDDKVVPIEQSKELYAALKKAGVDCSFKVVKGAGHDFASSELMQEVGRFFQEKMPE